MCSRTFCASLTTSKPATVAWPEVGERIVERMRTMVVLPEPLGAEQTEDLSRGYQERHPVERTHVAVGEGAHDVGGLDGVFGHSGQFRETRFVPSASVRQNRYLLSMAISDDEIAQVRSSTDIVALIGETVALKRSGQRWSDSVHFTARKHRLFR